MTTVALVVLPLSAEITLERVAAVIADLHPRREGLDQLRAGGFQLRIISTRLPRHLDWTFAGASAELGAMSIEVLGPVEGWLGRSTSVEVMAAVGVTGLGPSLTHDRFVALSQLVCRLAPLATAVVQPLAGYMAFPASDFTRDAVDYVNSGNPGPLWAYPLIRSEISPSWLETTGMAGMGLPEIAIPFHPSQREPVQTSAYALIRAMLAGGALPVGTVVGSPAGELRLTAELHGALWFEPTQLDPASISEARACVARKRAIARLLAPHAHFHIPRSAKGVAQELFYLQGGEGIAVTNGASDVAQPGTVAGQDDAQVELVLRSAQLGKWTRGVLSWAAQHLHAHDAQSPWRTFDRVALPSPLHGIAAVMLWPFGHIIPEAGRRVGLWCLLPIVEEELAAFRHSPDAQQRWIRARESRRDVELIEQRWDVLDAAAVA